LLVNRLKTNIFSSLVNVHLKLLSPEAFFSPKCTKYTLAARLRPDLLGELTALPQIPSCIKRCLLLRDGRGGVGDRRRRGGRSEEGRGYASYALTGWTPLDRPLRIAYYPMGDE